MINYIRKIATVIVIDVRCMNILCNFRQTLQSYRLCESIGSFLKQMLFRTILAPIHRIFQWSGLSPFLLVAKKCKLFGRSDSFGFTTLTSVNLLLNLIVGAQNVIQTDYNVTRSFDRLIIYGDLLMGLILRVHAITVLIECYAKRSIQSKLLAKFDEIGNIFAGRLNTRSNKRQLRRRFKKFIAIWLVKLAAFSLVMLLGPKYTFEWSNVYNLIVVLIAFYASALSYAQWLVYVDAIRYNIERMNVCLVKMRDAQRIEWFPTDCHIVRVVGAVSVDTLDAYDRLVQLRRCFYKTWQATALINRCFRWSLLIGISNGVFNVVFSVYSILYGLLTLKLLPWYDAVACTFWASLLSSDFIIISLICEDIDADVSTFFSQAIHFDLQN